MTVVRVMQESTADVQTWDEHVRFFTVSSASTSKPVAYFYLDPYSRPGSKRGGAWMDVCLGRSAALAPPGADVRLPVAYLVCNSAAPVGDKPSVMAFQEVITLFHEFGHGLQVRALASCQAPGE